MSAIAKPSLSSSKDDGIDTLLKTKDRLVQSLTTVLLDSILETYANIQKTCQIHQVAFQKKNVNIDLNRMFQDALVFTVSAWDKEQVLTFYNDMIRVSGFKLEFIKYMFNIIVDCDIAIYKIPLDRQAVFTDASIDDFVLDLYKFIGRHMYVDPVLVDGRSTAVIVSLIRGRLSNLIPIEIFVDHMLKKGHGVYKPDKDKDLLSIPSEIQDLILQKKSGSDTLYNLETFVGDQGQGQDSTESPSWPWGEKR